MKLLNHSNLNIRGRYPAVTYTVYISMAVYIVFLAVNIANYKFWIEGGPNNLASAKNTVIQKFTSTNASQYFLCAPIGIGTFCAY